MSNWYVRKTGSDNNGGSSSGASPDRNGSDMGTTNGNTQVTSASAVFSGADVGKGINIAGTIYRIATFTNSTTIQLERVYAGTTGINRTWAIGGALLTVNKILNVAAAVVLGGDTLWIGAGTYRELLTVTITSPTSEFIIAGDVDGAKTGDVGMVQITAYLTNDKTAPSASILLTVTGKSNLTFKNMMFVGGSGNMISGSTAVSNINFTDCCFYATRNTTTMFVGAVGGSALNWTVDRCIFFTLSTGNSISLTCPTVSGSDYDVNFVVKNSLFLYGSGTAVLLASSGALANKGNGVHIRNCTAIGYGSFLNSNVSTLSNTVTNEVYNCFLSTGSSSALSASATGGLITEDYNLLVTSTPRVNVSAGAHSISDFSYAPLFHIGQERIWGGLLRAFGEPTVGSSLLAFGNNGSQTAYDFRNNPRPAGGLSTNPAVGAMDRSNTFGKETGTVHTGSNAISITGPGYQDFLIPVDAVSTTFNIYGRYDSTYAGTRPQIQLLANGEAGVAAQTVTFTVGALSAWEQQSITFAPTSAGIVTLRVISNDTNGAGKAFFDSFSVS